MKKAKPRLDITPQDMMFLDSCEAGMTLTSPRRPMVPLPITVSEDPILAVRSDSSDVMKSCTSVEPSEMLFLDAAESHIRYFSSSLETATIGWSSSSMLKLSVVAVLTGVGESSIIFCPSLVQRVSVLPLSLVTFRLLPRPRPCRSLFRPRPYVFRECWLLLGFVWGV